MRHAGGSVSVHLTTTRARGRLTLQNYTALRPFSGSLPLITLVAMILLVPILIITLICLHVRERPASPRYPIRVQPLPGATGPVPSL